MDIAFDTSRRIFINENCFKDKSIGAIIMEHLERIGFAKSYIVKGIDLDIMQNGDYKVRCVGDDMVVFEIERQNDNLCLRQIGKLLV